jgi:tetratricopeptide (TPR) repeat protein
MRKLLFGFAGLALVASCSPQDVLARQGSSIRSTDYVQEAIEEKKKADAKRETEEQQRRAAEQTLQAHVDKGQAHMDLFEYEAANREFKEAYRISNDPAFLVKVGDAYRATGDCVEAQNLYAQYLHKKKDAADAKAVQAKIDEANACQTKAGSNLDKIRQHYKDGTTHYDLAEYDKAAAEFKEAYRLSNDPAYLFNIAQAYRMGGNCPEAGRFYERFLAVSPDAPNKEKIQLRITEMKACGKTK